MGEKLINQLESEMEDILHRFEQKDRYRDALDGYKTVEKKLLKLLGVSSSQEAGEINKVLAQCYLRQGNMYRSLRQPEEAARCIELEIEAARKSGNTITVAQSLFSEGVTLLSNQDIVRGLQLLEKAKVLFESGRTIDYIQGVGWYWIIKADLANLEIIQAAPEEIIKFTKNAIDKLIPIENWRGVARAYQARAAVYRKTGDERKSFQCLQKAVEYEELNETMHVNREREDGIIKEV